MVFPMKDPGSLLLASVEPLQLLTAVITGRAYQAVGPFTPCSHHRVKEGNRHLQQAQLR